MSLPEIAEAAPGAWPPFAAITVGTEFPSAREIPAEPDEFLVPGAIVLPETSSTLRPNGHAGSKHALSTAAWRDDVQREGGCHSRTADGKHSCHSEVGSMVPRGLGCMPKLTRQSFDRLQPSDGRDHRHCAPRMWPLRPSNTELSCEAPRAGFVSFNSLLGCPVAPHDPKTLIRKRTSTPTSIGSAIAAAMIGR